MTATTTTDRPRSRRALGPPGHQERRAHLLLVAVLAAVVVVAAAGACAPRSSQEAVAPGGSWSVTAWGERFEVFPEVDALVAGEAATAHTHVTRLADFSPVVDGAVEIVLTGTGGEQVFRAEQTVRPGIFEIELEPAGTGDYELAFRIRSDQGSEEIRGGRVRVGTAERPGRVLVAPAPRGAGSGGEPLSFLKEEQWRSEFATAWVRSGSLTRSVSGLARIRPPAGGEATLTAPVAGAVRPAPGRTWPYVGLPIARGEALVQVVPHVASDRSLAVLQAEATTAVAELEEARARLSRLEELLALEAISQREVSEARVRVETLEARRRAAEQDLDDARSAREGGSATGLALRAPFTGEVAAVATTPGATVASGDALVRVVRTDAVWLEIALPPSQARRIASEGVGGVVLIDSEGEPVRILEGEEGVRTVSMAPEVSPQTGTVTLLLEVPSQAGWTLGTSLQALVLARDAVDGIVVPASAVVDDGGVSVVYLQLTGESFARQEVDVLERQGERLLVDGLVAGQRLVTRGGNAIRRSSLMSSGEAHGHVH